MLARPTPIARSSPSRDKKASCYDEQLCPPSSCNKKASCSDKRPHPMPIARCSPLSHDKRPLNLVCGLARCPLHDLLPVLSCSLVRRRPSHDLLPLMIKSNLVLISGLARRPSRDVVLCLAIKRRATPIAAPSPSRDVAPSCTTFIVLSSPLHTPPLASSPSGAIPPPRTTFITTSSPSGSPPLMPYPSGTLPTSCGMPIVAFSLVHDFNSDTDMRWCFAFTFNLFLCSA